MPHSGEFEPTPEPEKGEPVARASDDMCPLAERIQNNDFPSPSTQLFIRLGEEKISLGIRLGDQVNASNIEKCAIWQLLNNLGLPEQCRRCGSKFTETADGNPNEYTPSLN